MTPDAATGRTNRPATQVPASTKTTANRTRRINRGRGHSYVLDGTPVDGVTTVLSNGVPKPALAYWSARETATVAMDEIELISQMDRDAGIDYLRNAPWRERDRAARRGTEVHGLAEKLIADEEVDVPEELTGHVDSYLKFLTDWNPQPVLVEAVVVNRTHRYMGTLDLVADLSDGRRWLLDVKTSRSGVFPETALQLAGYRFAETYIDADGAEQPMPAVDACGVIWVRADGYDLTPVTADADVFKYFLAAKWLAAYSDAGKATIGDALVPPGARS